MKPTTVILLIVFLMSGICSGQNVWKDQWLKEDKVLHLSCSMILTCIGTEFAKDLNMKNPEIAGVTFALTVGIAKEFLYDTSPSAYDLTADIVGAIAGVYLNRLVQKIPTPKWVERERKKLGLTVRVSYLTGIREMRNN